MQRLIRILAMAAILTGCCHDIDEILLEREDISFTLKGKDMFRYDPLTCQLSHSHEENIYRMHDDRMSEWVTVQCSERPDTEGQEITAEIRWTASSSIRSEDGLKFSVQKTSADGRVWLWNKSKKIGIVIKNL